MQFETKILSTDDKMDAAYIRIPFDVEEVFGEKRPKVKAVFDDKVTYRGILTRMKTDFHMLLMRQDVRRELNKQAGDSVKVSLEKDTEERIVELPEELKLLFEQQPDCKRAFEKLSYTNRKEMAASIADAKRAETKISRLSKIRDLLILQLKK